MSPRPIALLAVFAALAAPMAYAAGEGEAKPAEPAATAPMPMPMPMPMDCTNMPRHGHGMERGTPTAMPAGCGAMQASAADKTSSKAAAKAKTRKLGHNHARTHKLM